MAKLCSRQDFREVVFVVKNINNNILLEVLFKVLVVWLDRVLQLAVECFLKTQLFGSFIDINLPWLILLQRVEVSHLVDLFILWVVLLVFTRIFFLWLQKQAHLQLGQRELALRILGILFGIYRLLEVNKLAPLMSSKINVAVTSSLFGSRHNLDFEVIESLRILEVAEVL
jgi:hypothetical protein